MKTYTLSCADAMQHKPEHSERTAKRYHGGMNFDVTFKVWPNRASLVKTLDMQSKRATQFNDWRACS